MSEEMGVDLNALTVEDCLYMHDVLGLSIVCEDGHIARIADPEMDVKDCGGM